MQGGTVGQFPTVQQKIGQIRVKLMEMEYFLFGVAKAWDDADAETRLEMGDQLSAVKVSIVNSALEVVDLAMRIVGREPRGLSATNAFLFRVRFRLSTSGVEGERDACTRCVAVVNVSGNLFVENALMSESFACCVRSVTQDSP